MPQCRTLQTVMRSAAALMIWAAGACAFAPSPASLPRLSSSSSSSFSAPAALFRQRRHHRELSSSSSSDLPMTMQGRSPAPVSRKAALLLGVGAGISTLLPKEGQAITYGSGDFSGTSAVNGVLSAYGLPQLPDQRGSTPFLRQYGNTVVQFTHPSSWVINDRAKMQGRTLKTGDTGITVSDYRTAEGLTLFTAPTKAASVADVTVTEVGDLVVDAGGSKASGFKKIKEVKRADVAGRTFIFGWESNTVSGYNVERVSVSGVTVVKGVLYVLSGVVSRQRMKAMGPTLEQCAESLQVYTI